MNDSLGVRGGQRIRHLYRNLQELISLQRFPPDALLQALSLQLLPHDEGMALVILDFVDSADAGMAQLRRSPRFPLEALQGLGVANQIFRDELQGNVTAPADVFGLVHNSHATRTKFAQDAIVGDRLADHGEAPPL